jgi:hypothetical protein
MTVEPHGNPRWVGKVGVSGDLCNGSQDDQDRAVDDSEIESPSQESVSTSQEANDHLVQHRRSVPRMPGRTMRWNLV